MCDYLRNTFTDPADTSLGAFVEGDFDFAATFCDEAVASPPRSFSTALFAALVPPQEVARLLVGRTLGPVPSSAAELGSAFLSMTVLALALIGRQVQYWKGLLLEPKLQRTQRGATMA